jgi:hypothetical protein
MPRFTSIVTVCMNHHDHLIPSAAQVAAWPHHGEHLVVDWSSRAPLQREALPADPRLKLLRVEGEQHWNLARAYNFALAHAQGSCLFKLDADCWPQHLPAPDQLAVKERVCHFGSGPDGRLGQWLLDREIWERLGGFNELLQGYGFDDKDLKARLRFQLGLSPIPLPEEAIGVISNSVLLRAGDGGPSRPVELSCARAVKRTNSLANRVMAASCPWSAAMPPSRYRQDPATGSWSLLPGTLPRAPDEVQRELRRLRRESFWSEFLWIPAALVRQLPQRLLPAEAGGGFVPAPWHRLLWWLLRLPALPPVILLSRCNGGLSRCRAALAAAWRWCRRRLAQLARLLLATPLAALLPPPLRQLGLEARVEHSLARGLPVPLIWRDLQRLLRQHGSTAVMHRLLFRRGFRPTARADQVALFEAMAAEPQLPAYLQAYALVSLGYRSLKDGDRVQARRVQARIAPLLDALDADPATLACDRGNRRNRLKLLVSCLTVQSHLQLLLGDAAGLADCTDRMLRLIERIAWAQVPADVAYRLLTNAARVLGVAVLLAWREGATERLARAVAALERLRCEGVHERHRGSGAQENHRGYVTQVAQLARGLVLGDVATVQALADRLLNVRTPDLECRLGALLQP